MPSKSPEQHTLMVIAAHNPEIAKERGIPQSVAKEYVSADKRKAALKRLAAKRRRST